MNAKALWQMGKQWISDHKKEGFCARCGKPLPPRRRVWCSDECRDWWWNTFYWSAVRYRILKRDHYTCQICGKELSESDCNELTVHHIRPWCIYKDNSDDNMITVCKACHAQLHTNDNWRLLLEAKKCKKLDDFGGQK